MMARSEKRVEIYSWERGNNSVNGNPSLRYICGHFTDSGETFWCAKSLSDASWVYGVRSYNASFEPPLVCDIEFHYTKKGVMVIDNLKEVK